MVACYHGYKLYDGPEAEALVVNFYKQYHGILISDIVHVRRPDMQGEWVRSCDFCEWGRGHVTIVGNEACDFCGGRGHVTIVRVARSCDCSGRVSRLM